MRNSSGPGVKQTDDARPYPPRFRWLKRIALGYLGAVVLVAGLRGAWGRVADRRLAAEIAPIQGRREPVSGPALNVSPIPDAENGALRFR